MKDAWPDEDSCLHCRRGRHNQCEGTTHEQRGLCTCKCPSGKRGRRLLRIDQDEAAQAARKENMAALRRVVKGTKR